MSDNRFTTGWMAELVEPISKESRDFVSGQLDKIGVGLNYEGTLVYSIIEDEDLNLSFGVTFPSCYEAGGESLFNAVWNQGFGVVRGSVRFFVDIWYDGTDSTHSCITKEEFRKGMI